MFTFFIIILTECKNIDDEIEKMNLIEYSKEVPEEFHIMFKTWRFKGSVDKNHIVNYI